MAKDSANVSPTAGPAKPSGMVDKSAATSSLKLRGFDTNPQRDFGPQFWQAFRANVAHLYALSLPDPAEEARFTLSTRTYATPQGILMRCQGTAFVMTRGPILAAHGPDQLLILLQTEGTVDTDYGERRARRQPGDVEIIDYARPFRSTATDYENLMIVVSRESMPAGLLALEPHGLIFPRDSGAARLIGAALRALYAQADDLTVSEAEAAIEGIVALTAACARAKLAGDDADQGKSKRKAALDYIDTHFADAQLRPDEIAAALSLSRASLYRLLAVEGGIRAVLLKRRLDEALRLMLTNGESERSLTDIAEACGFGGASQLSRAFRARFGAPPRQYRVLVRQQDLDWQEVRFRADGFDPDYLLWRPRGLNGSKLSVEPDAARRPGRNAQSCGLVDPES